MRKNIKKTICMLLAIIMILSSSMVMFADEKVYFTGTIDDITVDDKIWVTILHEYSGLDKEFSQADFPGVEITGIEYVTSLKDPNKDYLYLNVSGYCQILVLILAEPTKLCELTEEQKVYADDNMDNEINAKDALRVLQMAARL